jgi:hypothetical protein
MAMTLFRATAHTAKRPFPQTAAGCLAERRGGGSAAACGGQGQHGGRKASSSFFMIRASVSYSDRDVGQRLIDVPGRQAAALVLVPTIRGGAIT